MRTDPERRRGDRRTRPDATTRELKVDRWIAVPRTTTKIDFDDPDSKAILFLCCSQHIVPCQRCQNTYRLGWISRSEPGMFPCPLCGSDLTPVVTAHAQVCVVLGQSRRRQAAADARGRQRAVRAGRHGLTYAESLVCAAGSAARTTK